MDTAPSAKRRTPVARALMAVGDGEGEVAELVGGGVVCSGFDDEDNGGGGVDDSATTFSTGAFLSVEN